MHGQSHEIVYWTMTITN